MASSDSERVYDASEISAKFGDDYDQPKAESDTEETPYRYLSQWYLTTAKGADKRIALPDNCLFKEKHILFGVLHGRTKGSSIAPIHVKLKMNDGTSSWSVDRSRETRGIWVDHNVVAGSGSGAWYWLQEPHETQLKVHLPIRAKFGLLSNVIDLLEEDQMSYQKGHLNRTAKQVHERLTCANERVLQQHQRKSNGNLRLCIFAKPFDYVLLSKHGGADFVKTHLKGLPNVEGSKFYASLKRTTGSGKYDFETSAELAEARSQQTSWGKQLPCAKQIRPNWVLELNVTDSAEVEEYKAEKSGASSKSNMKRRAKDDDQDDDNQEQPAKKRARKQRQHVLEDSDNDDEVEEEDKVKEDPIGEQNRYSAERMVQAINQIKAFLTPPPSDEETGSWDDVVEKFTVRDPKCAIAIARKLTDTPSGECKLLMITAFLNVGRLETKGPTEKEIMKKLFRRKPMGLEIFDSWKQEALTTLNRLAPEIDKTELPTWYQETVTFRLLSQFVNFISKCFVIENERQLNILKEKCDIDWTQPGVLKDVEDFERKYAPESKELRIACLRAQRHLDKIMNTPGNNPANSASAISDKPDTKTDAKPQASITPSPVSTSPVVANSKVAKAASKASVDEEKERKEKHFREQRTKARLKVAERSAVPVFQPGQRASSQQPINPAQSVPPASVPTPPREMQTHPTSAASRSKQVPLIPTLRDLSGKPIVYVPATPQPWRDPSAKPIEPVFVKATPLFLLEKVERTAYEGRKQASEGSQRVGQLTNGVGGSSCGQQSSHQNTRPCSNQEHRGPGNGDRRYDRSDGRPSRGRYEDDTGPQDLRRRHSRDYEQHSYRRIDDRLNNSICHYDDGYLDRPSRDSGRYSSHHSRDREREFKRRDRSRSRSAGRTIETSRGGKIDGRRGNQASRVPGRGHPADSRDSRGSDQQLPPTQHAVGQHGS